MDQQQTQAREKLEVDKHVCWGVIEVAQSSDVHVKSWNRRRFGKFFIQVGLSLTKISNKFSILSSVPLNLFYSKHGFGNNGNVHEGDCDHLLFFPLDVPPV